MALCGQIEASHPGHHPGHHPHMPPQMPPQPPPPHMVPGGLPPGMVHPSYSAATGAGALVALQPGQMPHMGADPNAVALAHAQAAAAAGHPAYMLGPDGTPMPSFAHGPPPH